MTELRSTPRILPVGEQALLVELADLATTLGFFDSLRAAELDGIVEAVPAARTVLVKYAPGTVSYGELADRLATLDVSDGTSSSGQLVEIPVHYDGADLSEVADLLGITTAELIRRHCESDYRVAFGGFAPGFAYLAGGDPLLDVPRRATPRTRIPAGAVGLAGTFSGVYPRESPGGWQLIGRTDVVMWDLDRTPPATLQPGDRVRFVDAGPAEASAASVSASTVVRAGTGCGEHAVEVLRPGAQAVLQDEGRVGVAGLGVTGSGALDRPALHTSNGLVGNSPGEAAIEFAQGGEIEAHGEIVLAVAGACGELRITRRSGRVDSAAGLSPIALGSGERLAIVPARGGLRNYLAVRGGFDVPLVLGSRATDTLSGIGTPPLTAGSMLDVRTIGAVPFPPVRAPEPWPSNHVFADVVELPVVLGPRDDWFTQQALHTLFTQLWEVTRQSNRVGLRLLGDVPLERSVTDELPSEGVVPGALQVPASGQPVLFLADHPVTGGYPVIAVLTTQALAVAAQLTPGTAVHFTVAGSSLTPLAVHTPTSLELP